jgi:hypothetical protein
MSVQYFRSEINEFFQIIFVELCSEYLIAAVSAYPSSSPKRDPLFNIKPIVGLDKEVTGNKKWAYL